MKIFLASLFCLAIKICCSAQDPRLVDSLKQALSTSDGVQRGLAILKLANEYEYTKPDSCLYYANIGLQLIKEPSVRRQIERSAPFYDVNLYELISIALSEQRNDSTALKFGFKALQIAERGNDSLIREVNGTLGEVYQNIGEPRVAIDYFRKSREAGQSRYMQQVYMGEIAACFYDAHEYDSALSQFDKMDRVVYLEQDQARPWPFPHYYLANVYSKTGDLSRAMQEYRIAIDFSNRSHLPLDLSQAYMGTASIFRTLHNLDSAISYARKSLDVANQIAVATLALDASNFLSAVYESKGIIDSAFIYQKMSNTIRDSLFSKEKIKQVQNFTFNEQLRQQEIKEQRQAYQNKIRIYSLVAGLIVVLLIVLIQRQNYRRQQKTNKALKKTLDELKSTQVQLIQSEKMASLGELTAGIAHEIQNPLNFVNNFSEVSAELIDEWKEQSAKGNGQQAIEIADDVKKNLEKIIHHGKRADAIVKGMLMHSRTSSGQKELTDINILVDEYLRLSYHGMRAKDKSFQAKFETNFDETIEKITIIPQDIGRVLLNLFTNAFYSVTEKHKHHPHNYEPLVSASTKRLKDKVEVRVRDNGMGIPQKLMDKIFQPFFTTKPTGQGTGLGLSLSYDIITKGHGGELRVETKEGEFAEFIILLPVP